VYPKIVVDGLGDAQTRKSQFIEALGVADGAVAGDHDQTADSHGLHARNDRDVLGPGFAPEDEGGVDARGAVEHASPLGEDSAYLFQTEKDDAFRSEQAFEAVVASEHVEGEPMSSVYEGANDGVDARGVASATEKTDAILGLVSRPTQRLHRPAKPTRQLHSQGVARG